MDDAEYRALYATARVFAFLSDYEGFGMTPLEALAHGVPSVLLDTPSPAKSTATGALFVPPVTSAIAAALHRLLTDDGRTPRACAGRARLAQLFLVAHGATRPHRAGTRPPCDGRSVDIIIVNYNTRDDLVACLARCTSLACRRGTGHRRRQRLDRRQRGDGPQSLACR